MWFVEFQKLVEASAQQFNGQVNAFEYYKPIKIVSAESQIVAGTRWKLVVQFQATSCNKHQENVDLKNCAVNPNGTKLNVEMTIWEKPWENFVQYTFGKSRIP
ncbi:hypothetical protein AB6A40_008188 [Gnathostoma spinigerum]|uniref:Cystatin domain-containing protein n=1 Tax=Gnathostoma spinigerum TaxID=75299 RepID=A0ABD6ENB6_9BILA